MRLSCTDAGKERDFIMDINSMANMNVSTEYTKYTKDTTNRKSTDKASDKAEKENTKKNPDAVYEKTDAQTNSGTYKINRMSADERKALVEQLKQDQEDRQNSLIELVRGMMTKQANTFATANFGSPTENVWKFLASGKFEVDEETKTKAQQDISEDGYYGVKQTSQRMFDFASALAGDDVDKMREMQKAMQKGYKQAEKTWGGKLPEISQKTIEAANKLFEEYYKSKDSAQTAQDFANSEILNQAGTSQIR